jgi:hypothetical protein
VIRSRIAAPVTEHSRSTSIANRSNNWVN